MGGTLLSTPGIVDISTTVKRTNGALTTTAVEIIASTEIVMGGHHDAGGTKEVTLKLTQ